MTTDTTSIASLTERARAAFEQADALVDHAAELERGQQVLTINKQLTKLGIESCGNPFTNRASHRVCVPLVNGGWDETREAQVHRVAVEIDDTFEDCIFLLVADLELDEDWDALRLYPAGRLYGLADVGRAIARGGHKPVQPATAADVVRRCLASVSGDFIDSNGAVFLSGCEAVCTALLDVAAAIRETAGA
jgi:hypothetical protein